MREVQNIECSIFNSEHYSTYEELRIAINDFISNKSIVNVTQSSEKFSTIITIWYKIKS